MDKAVTQCTEHGDCMILMDKKTHYDVNDGNWELKINAVGFQADGFTIESAITEYYGKNVQEYIWQ